MNKRMSDLLKGISYSVLQGSADTEINSVCYDSRRAEKGSLFIAVSGYTTDGHDFVLQAVQNGAVCLIVEKDIAAFKDITIIKVADSRKAMSVIACEFFDHPSKNLKVIGITGTNGKTTTIHLLQAIYEKAGKKVAMIGTIGAFIAGEQLAIANTTPESVDLQSLFSDMVKQGVEYCFMEVSSHALALDRVLGTYFYGTMFTNLSPDHLEFHHDMDDYFAAKKKLFFYDSTYSVINTDDPYGELLINEDKIHSKNIISYGLGSQAAVTASNIIFGSHNTVFDLIVPGDSIKTVLHLPGDFNLYNGLAAAAMALADGRSLSEITDGLNEIKNVKGRFEVVYQEHDFRVIIDFAHTEEGLEKILKAVRQFTTGRLILVFGVYVAGESEKGRYKRVAMGNVAGKYADYIIITSDNPKKQDPQMIIEQISEGVAQNTGHFFSVIDRKEALEHAVAVAADNDVILITGKGHETAQIIGDQSIPFNEKEIVLQAVDLKKKRQG